MNTTQVKAAFVHKLAKFRSEEQATRTISLRFAIGRIVLLGLMSVAVGAQALSEYKVKAAFLYNFAKFVEWPQDAFRAPDDPFTICVLGENPFGNALAEAVKGNTLNGRGFIERHITNTQEAKACQILFISSSEHDQLRAIMKELTGASILTVADTRGSAQQGSIVDFILQDNKVRFEFNTDAAERAQLKISSKLLSLAKIVR